MLKNYWMQRLLLLILVIWGITTVTFLIMYIVPRNPALAMAGNSATPEQIELFKERWGLNRPLWVRYFGFYNNLLHGDLGVSIRTERPVLKEILIHFPATFELATLSLLLSIILGIPLGVFSAIKRNHWFDHIVRVGSLTGVSIPNFWLGLLFLLIFYFNFKIFEPGRLNLYIEAPTSITNLYIVDSLLTGNWSVFIDAIRHIILPASTLGLCVTGYVARLTRASMLDVLYSNYIVAARSRGLSENAIFFKHALRNALIPTVSILGVLYGRMLAGSIVVETVFSWPGLGYFAYQSILKADQPSILGIVIVFAVFYSIVNFLVDISYKFLDPRIQT